MQAIEYDKTLMSLEKLDGTDMEVIVGNLSPNNAEDIWVTQEQMSKYFERDQSVISKHISKIYKDGEVDLDESCIDFIFQGKKGNISGKFKTRIYNLDVALSVGYKVNSAKGVRFRRWATSILKKLVRDGYVINERVADLIAVKEVINLLENAQRSITQGKFSGDNDFSEVLEVIRDYGYSFTTLQQYDEGKLTLEGSKKDSLFILDYDSAVKSIQKLKEELIKKGEATILFGQEKFGNGYSFSGLIAGIYQSVFGQDAYPSLEEKASHILYFIIKNHPFNDGNKRIAAFLFSLFIKMNKFDLKRNGEKKISDSMLAAIALMVAESNPKEKDQYIKLIVHSLRDR